MVKSLLESAGNYGFSTGISDAALKKYSAEYGEQLIAMETLADSQAIFECAFYDLEVMEFQSYMNSANNGVMEGTIVMEGFKDKVASIIETVKAKIKDLWEKFKSWMHNVKRYLEGIFMDAGDFVNKYEAELKVLKLSGFKYPLYKYPDILKEVDTLTKPIVNETEQWLDSNKEIFLTKTFKGVRASEAESGKPMSTNYDDDTEKYEFNDDSKTTMLHEFCDRSVDNIDEARNYYWEKFRLDVTYGDKKDEIVISKLDAYINVLKSSKSKLSSLDKVTNSADTLFKKALSALDKTKSDLDAHVDKGSQMGDRQLMIARMAADIAKTTYDSISFAQTVYNTCISEAKSALTEQARDYKAMIMKALRYKEPKK